MKILIINTVNFELNGISSVIMNYYKGMNKKDIDIDFMAISEINEKYIKEINRESNIYTLNRKKNPLKYFKELYKLMKQKKYDIVHIHGNSATVTIETIAAFMARVPVRIVHSHNTTCNYKKLHKILYPIMKKTYTHGFACGYEAGKWLFKGEKFEIVKNGIDLKKYIFDINARIKMKKKLSCTDKIILGHVGNFVDQKNHNFLIEVFDKLLKTNDNYELVLIGDGPLLNEIKNKVDILGISKNVKFIGKTTEVNSYMQAMDILLLPSHYEGLPVVLIEAQALGLPCLVSDKVSQEAKITELVKFIPIEDSDIWIKNIKNQCIEENRDSKKWHIDIKNSGYDISKNSENMKCLYKRYLEEI